MKKIIFILFLIHFSLQISDGQWMQVNNGMGNSNVTSFAYTGNNLFAGTYGNGVYLSTNNGINWIQTSLNNLEVNALAINGNNIFAGTEFNGIYRSTNNGTSWTLTLNRPTIRALIVSGNIVYAGTPDSGIYKSTNNGNNWNQTSLNNRSVMSFTTNGSSLFAGCDISGVYLSTNEGINWIQTPLNNRDVRTISINGNNVFAGTFGNGMYHSTDNGTSWPQIILNNEFILSSAIDGINIFAGSSSFGVYVSNDNGANWIVRNEGLPYAMVEALCVFNNYLFAGRYNGGVYRRPLGELTEIKPVSNEFPSQFSLSQNYPNPFNPSTKIKFDIPKSSIASLIIYDVLGREVETLFNQSFTAGVYETEWYAANFSSGVYYYKLVVGDNINNGGFTETKKMVLIK